MKKIACLSIVVVSSMIAIHRSEAIGTETLGCLVNVGTLGGVYTAPECFAGRPRTSYTVDFRVLGSAGPYTHAWATSHPVVAGCTSTSDFCIVRVAAMRADQSVTASVTLGQSGLQHTVSAVATVPAVCFVGTTPHFC